MHFINLLYQVLSHVRRLKDARLSTTRGTNLQIALSSNSILTKIFSANQMVCFLISFIFGQSVCHGGDLDLFQQNFFCSHLNRREIKASEEVVRAGELCDFGFLFESGDMM